MRATGKQPVINWRQDWPLTAEVGAQMIPLIVPGGPPKAGLARVGEDDAAEPEAGFASLMQDEAKEDTPEVDPDTLPLAGLCAPLPKPPDPTPKPPEGDAASADAVEGGMMPARIAPPEIAGAMAVPEPASPQPRQAEVKVQSVVLKDEMPKPRPRATQGPAEIAMRAALQVEDTPDEAILPTVDPAATLPDPQTQSAALPPEAPLRQAEPTPPRAAPLTLHPAQVVAQILPKARAQNKAVELLLAPEELGKLRFVIQHDGASVKISLTAERPETLDLLRRHADQLVQEFRQSGYSGATIDFGNWSRQGQQGQPAQPILTEDDQMAVLPDIPPAATLPAPGMQGLNLRL